MSAGEERYYQAGLAHAYLIEGPADLADQAAKSLAKKILCEKGGADPENFDKGNCADFLTISQEKISIEQVRDLISQLYRKPLESSYRVFLLSHADEMREDGQNALLKSLEEPPDYLVWILCSINRMKLLPTIRSRCRIIKADKLLDEPFATDKAGFVDLDGESWRLIFSMMDGAFSGRKMEIFLSSDPYEAWSEKKRELIDAMTIISADMLQYKASGLLPDRPLPILDYSKRLAALSEKTSLSKIEKLLRQLEDLKGLLKVNINFRMALDTLFIHWGEDGSLI